jgi:mannose-6-phosphate isomerase class I
VIRAGLTGKAVDVPTLLATVDFNKSGAGECKPEDLESGVIRYAPATPKFRLTAYMNKEIELAKAGDTFAMAVILQGEAAVATPDGEFTVQRGEILARPAAAVTGSIRPLTENTIIFWVDTAY